MLTSWNKKQLADVIEQTRKSSTYQGFGPHPVCLDEMYWKMIIEALRADDKNEA